MPAEEAMTDPNSDHFVPSFWLRRTRHALTTGTVWQAEAIADMAKLLLKQRNSPEARIALARGIVECAKAIEAHETPRADP
jgi:hypothetical protein